MTGAASPLLADEMLGKLARELRALGYDVAYARDVADDTLLEQAASEGRVLLTRDRRLAERAAGACLLVESLDPADQLDEVVTGLDLHPSRDDFLSRCVACNGLLVEGGDAASVPSSVQGKQLWTCPDCARTYWHGTHADDMLRRLGRHFDTP